MDVIWIIIITISVIIGWKLLIELNAKYIEKKIKKGERIPLAKVHLWSMLFLPIFITTLSTILFVMLMHEGGILLWANITLVLSMVLGIMSVNIMGGANIQPVDGGFELFKVHLKLSARYTRIQTMAFIMGIVITALA